MLFALASVSGSNAAARNWLVAAGSAAWAPLAQPAATATPATSAMTLLVITGTLLGDTPQPRHLRRVKGGDSDHRRRT
jgi:hypothetical protein